MSRGVNLGKNHAILNIIVRACLNNSVFSVIESPPLLSPAIVEEDALRVAGLSFTTLLIFKAVFFAAEATQQVSCFTSCGCNFQHLDLQFLEFSLFICICNISTTIMCTFCATSELRALVIINDPILGVWKIHIIKNVKCQSCSCVYIKGQRSLLLLGFPLRQCFS